MEAARRAMQRDHDEDPDDDRQREVSVRRPLEGWDRHQTGGRPVSAISCAVAPTKRARSVPRDIDVTAARRRLFTVQYEPRNYRYWKVPSAATSSDHATGWRRRAPTLEGLEIF